MGITGGWGRPTGTPTIRAAASRGERRRYVGVLAPSAASRIQRLVASFGITIEVCDPEAFLGHLDDATATCAVIDPAQLAADELAEAVARLRVRPRPAIVYSTASPTSARDAAWIACETGAAVVFQSPDEDRSTVVRTFVSVTPPGDAAELLAYLEPSLASLPLAVRSGVVAIFAADAAVESANSLATRAGISRRSLDRWLARAGISSTRRLIAAPLVLRAARLLLETSLPIRTVAAVCGLRSTRRLNDYMQECTGLTPAEFRSGGRGMTDLIRDIAMALTGQRSPVE